MPVYLIGIDEAGYGPQLGPLVVSCVVFELPDAPDSFSRPVGPSASAPLCLWSRLSRVINRHKTPAGTSPQTVPLIGKIVVCDSKKLYQPAQGLKHLENTALSFAKVIHPAYPDSFRNGLVLPVTVRQLDIDNQADLLVDELKVNSIKFCEFQSRVVEPQEFNAGVARCQNKADFLWDICAELMSYCVRKYQPAGTVIIKAGKQGGRTYYESKLKQLWPDKKVRIMMQDHCNSSYLIDDDTNNQRRMEISFIKDGDASEFVIALASIFAKYSRELAMIKLNRYFRFYLPDLQPTSGYYADSREFIKSILPVLAKNNLDKNDFIRNK